MDDHRSGRWQDAGDDRGRAASHALARAGRTGRAASSFSNVGFDSHLDFSLTDRCITRGYPGSMLPAIYGDSYQIVQAPGYVAIRYEMVHETRIIPLDSRPHVSKGVRLDMGDAARPLGRQLARR